jgi:dTDP-4-amino-4,6-dideoxygalactose transaminase
VQAAVLDLKLRLLPKWIEHRRMIARLYNEGLAGISGVTPPPYDGEGYFDVFQNYVITTPEREGLREHLQNAGVETLVSWPKPVWEHRALELGNPSLPKTEVICRQVLSLPMSAETTPEHVTITVEAIREFFAERFLPRASAMSASDQVVGGI